MTSARLSEQRCCPLRGKGRRCPRSGTGSAPPGAILGQRERGLRGPVAVPAARVASDADERKAGLQAGPRERDEAREKVKAPLDPVAMATAQQSYLAVNSGEKRQGHTWCKVTATIWTSRHLTSSPRPVLCGRWRCPSSCDDALAAGGGAAPGVTPKQLFKPHRAAPGDRV